MHRKLAALSLTLAFLLSFAPARAEGTVCDTLELGWYVILKSADFSTVWTFLDVEAAR